MKSAIKRLAEDLGLHVTRTQSVPWGCDKYADVAWFAPDIALAIDVGGNSGQTVRVLRADHPFARIISFEPVPSTFAALQAACAGLGNVECIQAALGEAAGVAQMTNVDGSEQNTLNVAARPGDPTVDVPVMTLDAFCAERGIDHIDLLKIDTEGFEMPVLRGAIGLLKRKAIRLVLAEADMVPNPASLHGDFREITDLMLSLGYNFVGSYTNGVSELRGCEWCDILFALPGENPIITCSPFVAPVL